MSCTASSAITGVSCFTSSSDKRYKIGGKRGEVYLLEQVDDTTLRRTLLGDFEVVSAAVPMRAEIVEVGDDHIFVFAGVRKQTSRAVKIWHLRKGTKPREFELNARDGKLRGFGCVVFCGYASDNKNKLNFRVACGIGFGNAHVWNMELDLVTYSCECSCLGSVLSRRNSILAMGFSQKGGILVTVALEKLTQLWELKEHIEKKVVFKLSSSLGAVVTHEKLEDYFTNPELAKIDKLEDEFNIGQVKATEAVRQLDGWRLLFDDDDDRGYQGDLDLQGRPSGYGTAFLFVGNQNLVYRGHWKHGKRHGFGSLVDDDTGQVIYEGSWNRDLRHGHGCEIFTSEEYRGDFHKGKRDGFGVLRILKEISLSRHPRKGSLYKRYPGETYSGFWHQGKLHGIGTWEYPVCPQSLNTKSPSALMHFGKIASKVVHEHGTIVRELFFHRADGVEIQVDERYLMQQTSSKSRGGGFHFSPNVTGKWKECGVCWSCLQASSHKDALNFCDGCSLTIHTSCLQDSTVLLCPSCKLDLVQLTFDRDCANLSYVDLVQKWSTTSRSSAVKAEKRQIVMEQTEEEMVLPSKKKMKKNQKKLEDKEEQDGIAKARKIAKRGLKERTKTQTDYLTERLTKQRVQEVTTRRRWKSGITQQQSELAMLEQELELRSSALTSKQTQLNRMEGRELLTMEIQELDELQLHVEKALDSCRVALEISTK